jgi:hypothetical protein
MHFHPKMMEIPLAKDETYDKAVCDYFFPYYKFIVNMCKVAIASNILNQELVGFCKCLTTNQG